MSLVFSFSGPKHVRAGSMSEIIRQETMQALGIGTVELRERMITASPLGLGTLKQSWQSRPPVDNAGKLTASVSSANTQALVIDDGAKPHFPPEGALDAWIRRKLKLSARGDEAKREFEKVSYLIRRKISLRGLPNPASGILGVFTRTAAAYEARLRALLSRAQERSAERVNRGEAMA